MTSEGRIKAATTTVGLTSIAFPTNVLTTSGSSSSTNAWVDPLRRSDCAKAAMAALISRMDSGLYNCDDIADMAVQYADALQRRLNK